MTQISGLDDREIATILAGLRLRQQQQSPQEGGDSVEEIATNLDTFEALSVQEIERLCGRLLEA